LAENADFGIAPAIDNSSLWNLNDPSTWIPTERLDDLGSAVSTGNFARNSFGCSDRHHDSVAG